MLNHHTGDLFALAENGEFDFIIHGCNCMCTMGSGIARQVRDKYPEAYRADQETEPGDVRKLGNYTRAIVTRNNNTFQIINAYTQFGYNRRGEKVDRFEYNSFQLILRKLAHIYGDKHFGLPYIGMGLAGGDEETIMEIIEDFANTVQSLGGSVTLVKYE